MRRLACLLTVLMLTGCISKPIVRPREIVGHAVTHDTVVLLYRTWLGDGTLQFAMEVSFFPDRYMSVKAGQNLDLYIDGQRYRLASRADSAERATTDPALAPPLSPEYLNYYQRISAHHLPTSGQPFQKGKIETLFYDGLPPEFMSRVARASKVKALITTATAVWDFEFTQVLIQQFHDWAE